MFADFQSHLTKHITQLALTDSVPSDTKSQQYM